MPRQRMDGNAGAHRRTTEVRIEPPCRLRVSVRLQVGALAAAQPDSGELHLFRRLPPCHARHYGMPDLASKTKSALPGSKGGGEFKCLQGWSVNPGTRSQSKHYGYR